MQLSSTVKSSGLKFEFSMNEIIKKPSIEDISSIENIMKGLIEKALPIHSALTTETNNTKSIRKLRDVLYPLNARVVRIGNETSEINNDNSAEFCCGTHATNTNQIKEITITSFTSNGNFYK